VLSGKRTALCPSRGSQGRCQAAQLGDVEKHADPGKQAMMRAIESCLRKVQLQLEIQLSQRDPTPAELVRARRHRRREEKGEPRRETPRESVNLPPVTPSKLPLRRLSCFTHLFLSQTLEFDLLWRRFRAINRDVCKLRIDTKRPAKPLTPSEPITP